MQCKQNNLYYKEKYLKYKYKYLALKNQIGGGILFDLKEKTCVFDKNHEYKDYRHYNSIKHQCCIDDEYKICKQMAYTIDHKIIPKDSNLKIYNFDLEQVEYKGNDKSLVYLPILLDSIIKTRPCNFYTDNIKSLDETHVIHDLITDCPQDKKPIQYYKSFTKTNLSNKKIEIFDKPEVIGSGSFGVVVKYIGSQKNYIAVKYGTEENINKEIEIIKKIANAGNLCSDLIVKYIVNEDCIIMENAIGTIKDLKPEIIKNINIIVDILYAILIAIKCLYDSQLYYTDIKMSNILFRNTKDGIQIILGDLGSISDANSTSYATYFPYEYIYGVKSTKDSIISWGIGILILDLLNIDHSSIEYKNLYELRKMSLAVKNEDIDINNIYESIVLEVTRFIDTLTGMTYILNIDKNNFILATLIELIKNTLLVSVHTDNKRLDLDAIIVEINNLRVKQEQKTPNLWERIMSVI